MPLSLSDALGVLGILMSIAIAVWQTQKAHRLQAEKHRLQREKRSITVAELQVGSEAVAKKILAHHFLPDFLLAPDYRGAIIATLVAKVLAQDNRAIPVVVGFAWPKRHRDTTVPMNGYSIVENKRWHFGIPKTVELLTNRTCLIVDDISQSGDALRAMKNELIRLGFEYDKIKTATLVVSDQCVKAENHPDYY